MNTTMKQVWKYIAFALCLLAMPAVAPTMEAETLDSYGNEFVALSQFRPGEGCMLIGLFEETHVTLGNGEQFVLLRGERRWLSVDHWVTKDGYRTSSLFIHADEPIQVRHTASFGETYVSTLLPALTCESPKEQHFTFAQKTSKAKLYLLTPANQVAGFMLDGKVLKMDDSYAVEGKSDWVCNIIDLGTRKAGSTLTLSAPHNRALAAIVGNTYEYLSACELEASVTIDTILGVRHDELVLDQSSKEGEEEPLVAAEEYDPSSTGELAEYDEPKTQTKDSLSHHRAAIYLQGAFAGMPVQLTGYNTKIGLGYGAALGAMYEFQHKSFLMQTGAGFYWLDRRVDILDQPAPNRYDRSVAGGVEIPLLFGQNFKAVYYLLGVKMGVNVMMIDRSGCDPIPTSTHRVNSPILREKQMLIPNCFMFDPRVSAEFGFNLGQEPKGIVRSRLAFFADWGLYPEQLTYKLVPDETPAVSTEVGDPADYATYKLTHFLSLDETYAPGNLLHHFQVGLKFTLVLGK